MPSAILAAKALRALTSSPAAASSSAYISLVRCNPGLAGLLLGPPTIAHAIAQGFLAFWALKIIVVRHI